MQGAEHSDEYVERMNALSREVGAAFPEWTGWEWCKALYSDLSSGPDWRDAATMSRLLWNIALWDMTIRSSAAGFYLSYNAGWGIYLDVVGATREEVVLKALLRTRKKATAQD